MQNNFLDANVKKENEPLQFLVLLISSDSDGNSSHNDKKIHVHHIRNCNNQFHLAKLPAPFLGTGLCLMSPRGSPSLALPASSTFLFPLSSNPVLLSSLFQWARDSGIVSFLFKLNSEIFMQQGLLKHLSFKKQHTYRELQCMFCKQRWEINGSLLVLSNLNNVFFISVSLIWAIMLFPYIFLFWSLRRYIFCFTVLHQEYFKRKLIKLKNYKIFKDTGFLNLGQFLKALQDIKISENKFFLMTKDDLIPYQGQW